MVFLRINSFESSCRHCCVLQIRPVEEQLKQRVIGKRYCISRKRKSIKGSTSRARLTVCLSVKCLVRNEKLSPSELSLENMFSLDESIFGVWGDMSPIIISIVFVYTHLNVKTVPFQEIQFSVSTVSMSKQFHFKQFSLS